MDVWLWMLIAAVAGAWVTRWVYRAGMRSGLRMARLVVAKMTAEDSQRALLGLAELVRDEGISEPRP